MDMSKAARDVIAERERQMTEEGFGPEHDDAHERGELAMAGACYAHHAADRWWHGGSDISYADPNTPRYWPWHQMWWKPKDFRSDLVRAAALILAEIERLDRIAERRG